MDIIKTEEKHFTEKPPETTMDGTMDRFLEEPVPRYMRRNGDELWFGKNNTLIVLGRDRNPADASKGGEVKSKSADTSNMVSGYSNHQGAGAIDIVVGRGSPYPVVKSKGKETPQAQAPKYIDGEEPSYAGSKLREGVHDGTCMDAARIYMSQMCDIDKYFDLPDVSKLSYDVKPSSAIILKGDRLRMHSRRDVKIYAGGGLGVDSNGFTIKESGAIHLISKGSDGSVRGQQPIPMGNNLVSCLRAIIQSQQDMVSAHHKSFWSQFNFNLQLMMHGHVGGAGPVAFNPAVMEAGMIKLADDLSTQMNTVGMQFLNNTFAVDATYLNPASSLYINSLNNTTN